MFYCIHAKKGKELNDMVIIFKLCYDNIRNVLADVYQDATKIPSLVL